MERSLSSVTYVMIALYKRTFWIAMLHQFIKKWGLFECDICGDSFKQKIGLIYHVTSVHEGRKPFSCIICGASFTSKQGLKSHIVSIHEKRKPFQCKICDTCFTEKGSLNKHVVSIHEERKRFNCKICECSFASKGRCFEIAFQMLQL